MVWRPLEFPVRSLKASSRDLRLFVCILGETYLLVSRALQVLGQGGPRGPTLAYRPPETSHVPSHTARSPPSSPITGTVLSPANGCSRSLFRKRTAFEEGGSWSLSTTCTPHPLVARSSKRRSASEPRCTASACSRGRKRVNITLEHVESPKSALPRERHSYFVSILLQQPKRGCPAAWVVVHHQHGDGCRLQARLHTAQPGDAAGIVCRAASSACGVCKTRW